MCNTMVGFDGEMCTDYCVEGAFAVSSTVFVLITSLIAGVISFDFLIQRCQQKRIIPKAIPGSSKQQHTTNFLPIILSLIFVGSLLTFIVAILNAVNTLGFPWNYEIQPQSDTLAAMVPERGAKRPPIVLEKSNTILNAIAQSVSVTSVVLLPFVWVGFSCDELRLQGRARKETNARPT
jgi:hypothetical protein